MYVHVYSTYITKFVTKQCENCAVQIGQKYLQEKIINEMKIINGEILLYVVVYNMMGLLLRAIQNPWQ